MSTNPQVDAAKIKSPKETQHLLDALLAIRASVGEGLNDDELTHLLRRTTRLTEAGFALLSFPCGVVTPGSRNDRHAKEPLPLGPDLLQDLSAFYQA